MNMDTKQLKIWCGALIAMLLFFYGLDHFIMNIQGLPLSWNLTPSQ